MTAQAAETMTIMEDLPGWQAEFEATWLAKWQETGETDWSIYPRPTNKSAPAGPGIELANSRLVLISSAGGYLPASQQPFDAENDLGDYTIRRVPVDAPFSALAYAHTHYDHTAINADPQVLVPLRHLAELVNGGAIGELAPDMISFSGYQPDVVRTVEELIPAIVAAATEMQAAAALLVPA